MTRQLQKRQLQKLHFLIHPFCYAEMTRGIETIAPGLQPYVEREQKCAERWRRHLHGFSSTDALIVVPAIRNSEVLNAYLDYAGSILGDRCFVLDCADAFAPEFWLQGDDFRSAILSELQAAFVHQKLRCNNEEIVTDLHCLACQYQFRSLVLERGYTFEKTTVLAKGWGASFDGCVTKYTSSLRRLLGLAHPIAINFNLTVPDAQFLLDIFQFEWIELTNCLRLFLFERAKNPIALFTATSHSLANEPLFVVLPHGLSGATVLSKQGIRLWPEPEEYQLPDVPPEYSELSQSVVTVRDGCLRIPVNAGFVYRLAKAPSYIFAPEGMSCAEFRTLLMQAQVVEMQQP